MRSSWRVLAPFLPWLLALFIAVAPATAKSASREKFSDTLAYPGEIALQLVEASEENCSEYDRIASGDSLYNYFRDYNPGTGRYVQSDPVGLLGGYGTYSYAHNAPLFFFDPLGEKGKGVGANKQKGADFENWVQKNYPTPPGCTLVPNRGPGSGVWTPHGYRFPDFRLVCPGQTPSFVECKAGNSPYEGTRQQKKDDWIKQTSGRGTEVVREGIGKGRRR